MCCHVISCGLHVEWSCFFSCFFFFKQKTAYEMRISDWSSDVCSSDLLHKTILAADIEEASALIALEAANLLAGINDEQFRLNVRHRVAERLAQTPTISAA